MLQQRTGHLSAYWQNPFSSNKLRTTGKFSRIFGSIARKKYCFQCYEKGKVVGLFQAGLNSKAPAKDCMLLSTSYTGEIELLREDC